MEIFIFGILFGVLIRYANLNRFNVISGDATLEDLTVAKTILMVIGVGAILLNIEIVLGLASFHVKPFILGGVIIGGVLFGIGMAILGYCPGTLPISLGEGSIDALIGIIGGLLGGLVYTLVLPYIQPLLGANLGQISLSSMLGNSSFLFFLVLLSFSIILVALAFILHNFEKRTVKDRILNYKWVITGIGLAVLNGVVFLASTTNRPIGASTSFPYVADYLASSTQNSYFQKIAGAGNWELIFLAGAFLASLVWALIRREFKFKAVYSRWEKAKGPSVPKRLVWAFAAGFVLIFGARMAGGCTSGHIISGGMQVAISSLVFGIFVFASFIITGKIFYRTK